MSASDIIQVVISVIMLAALVATLFQLRQISASLRLAQRSNTINAIAHCAGRYETVIASRPSKNDADATANWWYRYWDLFTEEFNFFRKSMLDPDIFELWMNELATVYHAPLIAGGTTRVSAHTTYLTTTLPRYAALHAFFASLSTIARDTNSASRADMVHRLVLEYAPPGASFELTQPTAIERG